MNIVQKIIKKMMIAKKVLLICHVDPDGDTVWSALALGSLLRQRKILAQVICHDPLPETLRIFPEAKNIGKKLPTDHKDRLIIAMEAGNQERVGYRVKVDINIDHHLDNARYAELNWVDGQASALGSLIYCLARAGKFRINKEIAAYLYAAISSDTGGFRFGNTTAQTFADAEALVKKGAEPDKIYHMIYENVSQGSLQKLGQALQDLRLIAKGRVVYSIVKKVDAETAHGIIDVIRTIRGTEIAILFKEVGPRDIRVSFRSKGTFNVQKIANKFNGGGHKKAAGCSIRQPLNKAINLVLAEIKKNLHA